MWHIRTQVLYAMLMHIDTYLIWRRLFRSISFIYSDRDGQQQQQQPRHTKKVFDLCFAFVNINLQLEIGQLVESHEMNRFFFVFMASIYKLRKMNDIKKFRSLIIIRMKQKDFNLLDNYFCFIFEEITVDKAEGKKGGE